MMEFRIIKGAIWGNKTQKGLAFLTIFLASSLIAAMLNLTLGVGDKIAKELRSYGSNIVVLPHGGSLSLEIEGQEFRPLQGETYLEESRLKSIKEIFWRNNIVGFAPFLEGRIKDKEGEVWALAGTYFDKIVPIADEPSYQTGAKILYPFWSVEGEWIEDDSMTEILLGEELAKNRGLKIGDTIWLGALELKVKGILHGFEEGNYKIIASLSLVQKLLDAQGKVSRVEVSALTVPENDLSIKARRDPEELDALEYDTWYCTAYVSSIAYQIEEEYKGASAKALMKVSDGESKVVKKIQSLMGVVTLLALLGASIGIASLMASEIHRRKKEIGLLKALGASSLSIYALFVSESLLVALLSGALGGLAGYGISMLMALGIFGHTLGVSWIILPLAVSFALLVALFGSLLPMRGVVDLLPAEVLYGRQ